MSSPTYDTDAREAALLESCRSVLAAASRAGAEEAEVLASYGESITVTFEKGDLKIAQVDEGGTCGVRAFEDRRVGFSSTNQTGPAALARTATDAVSLARVSVPDDANILPSPRPASTTIDLWHDSLAELSVEEAVGRATELVEAAQAVDPRIALDRSSLTLSRGSVGLAASTGVECSESSNSMSMSLFGMAVDGDDVGGFDYWGDLVRDAAEFQPRMQDVVSRFSEAVLGNLDAGKAETYSGPVLLSPSALLSILINPLVGSTSSIAVQRGRSFLAGKLGERVAPPCFHLRDDPHDTTLAGATAQDREGQPAEPFSLVEDGVLQGYYYNGYSAAVENRESTGHASGGARGVPGLGLHAVSLAPGDGGDREALLAQLDRGLLIQRFSGSVDPASGDFSGVAKSARWVEHGQVQRSVRETLVSGNAFEVLQQLIALGSTSETIMSSVRAPWALAQGFSVTAG